MQKTGILKQYWGYDAFRPLQENVIDSVLAGEDTLALMPTGGGKSLCFQVPALMKDGLCIVVSPLIALMKDQVNTLRKKGITAFAIVSGMSRRDLINTFKLATTAGCKFLYVSPERLETPLFLEYLPAMNVNLIAVDEAHCISQWGYDFRPSYLRIAALREHLPGVPVLALTASATASVQEDICRQLNFPAAKIIRQSFARPALSYSAFQIESKLLKLVEILQNVKGSSIVYCRSRKRTKEIAQHLLSYGIDADYYHAGLDGETRSAKQDAWIHDRVSCMVCTNAFGMGIDKSAVRSVIHYDLTDCLENYYQEAGRAGRDGKKSYAVLLFQPKDFTDLNQQAEERFPPLGKIRELYQALMNYLQLPNGTGEGSYYDFDLHDFVVKFKYPANFVINVLKVLQQENLISFSEQVFTQSKVEFVCNKESLYNFERSHVMYVPLIQSLLRTYEGIFDQPVFVFEKSLAYHGNLKKEEVIRQLQVLQSCGIIKYIPQKDNPQLYFLQNRVKSEELRINEPAYAERKKIYFKRLRDFISYAGSETCRSRQIASYFGDDKLLDCGICDNCLKSRRTALSTADFATLQRQILAAVSSPIPPATLLKNLTGFGKPAIETVIDFLTSEQLIILNKEGLFERRN